MRPIMKALRVVFRLGLLIVFWIALPSLPATAQTTSPKEAQPLAPKHFNTVKAEWLCKTYRRVAPMPVEDRVAYQSADTIRVQADGLYAKGKYAQAQPLYEKVL